MAQRKALSNAFATKYRHPARPEKSAILAAPCSETCWNRDPENGFRLSPAMWCSSVRSPHWIG